MKIKGLKFQNPMIISIVLHIIIGIAITPFIQTEYIQEKEFIEVDWVPPPPIKMKPHRPMPKQLPKAQIADKKTPSKASSKTVKRSAHNIPEVVEKSPEIVRESVKINRDAKVSDILPVITTTARFDSEVETHKAISQPKASPKKLETPGTGIKTERVIAEGKNNYQGFAGKEVFGSGKHLGNDAVGLGIGDGFADVGTEAPKYVDVEELRGQNPNDLFGIGKSVDEGRNEKAEQDVVYVLDLSSSMKGNKLELAKQALKDALAMLRKNDRFNIILFNNKVELYSKKFQPVNKRTLRRAYNYLDKIKIHRGTNLSEALKMALQLDSSTIVLISDGGPTRGIRDTTELLKMVERLNKSNARIMPIGIGRGHSTKGIELLTKLALQNKGKISLIDISDE